MNILILHPNFPGQFEYLAASLARNPALSIAVVCRRVSLPVSRRIRVRTYQVDLAGAGPFEGYVREGIAVLRAIKELERCDLFRPDLIIGHSGWGSLLFIRAAYPSVPVIGYFEWYFRSNPALEKACFLDMEQEEIDIFLAGRNAAMLAQLDACDKRFSPTQWQRSRFPDAYRTDIRVIHEGVDTRYYSPLPEDRQKLEKLVPGLCGAQEIVTYVSRGLEPTRCFPQFMDAVRILLRRRPHCHVVLAGSDRAAYSGGPAPDKTWKQAELEKGGFDPSRVHFTGWLAREDFRTLLRASTVHVYLTLPFVLSWSMVQAMSAGCCLVASATEPVEEVVRDGENGLLADYRSPTDIAERIEEALSDAGLRKRLSVSARETILERYRLESCLQEQMYLFFGRGYTD